MADHDFFGDGGQFCCVVVGASGELCGLHYAIHHQQELAREARALLEDGDLDVDGSRYLIERVASIALEGEAAAWAEHEAASEIDALRERVVQLELAVADAKDALFLVHCAADVQPLQPVAFERARVTVAALRMVERGQPYIRPLPLDPVR